MNSIAATVGVLLGGTLSEAGRSKRITWWVKSWGIRADQRQRARCSPEDHLAQRRSLSRAVQIFPHLVRQK
jgi:hypothetical protein